MTWLIIVAVVVVLVVGAVAYLQKRSAALKDRFGPEYEHVVEERGDRRTAEAELRGRAKRHDALELHDLTPETRDRYADEWQAVQAGFVDDPTRTVAEADALVAQVMRDRGYPIDEWEERYEMVSVDHPELAENYRVAHAIHERGTADTDVSLDDLREAFQRYRSLFDELLADGTADDVDDDDMDDDDVDVAEVEVVEVVETEPETGVDDGPALDETEDEAEAAEEARAARGERP
jgi:hypothetical protein